MHREFGGDSWSQLTKRTFHSIWHHGQHMKCEKKKEGVEVWNKGICIPKLLLRVMEPCFSGGGWTSACPWEAVNEFLDLLCLCVGLLLYLIICPYLNPWGLLAFYHSNSLLPPTRREWASSYMGLSCQLRLNHDRDAPHLGSPSMKVLRIRNKKNSQFQTYVSRWTIWKIREKARAGTTPQARGQNNAYQKCLL